jgi:hypothetical protein
MARVIKRIFPEGFDDKIPSLINIEVDCIMKNKAVFHGVILSVGSRFLLLRNNVLNEKKILFDQLQEVTFT